MDKMNLISRYIHQIYWNFSNPIDSTPRPEWQSNSETFITMNQGWTYKRWNKQEAEALICSDDYNWIRPLWDNISAIEQTDVLRYIIMHKYGGLYADMDYICIKSLEPLRWMGYPIILFNIASSLIVNTNPIASSPGHPFWLTLLKSLSNSPFVRMLPNYFKVMLTTGPLKLSKHRWMYPDQSQIVVFPHKYLEPENKHLRETFITDSVNVKSTWIKGADRWKATGLLLGIAIIIVVSFYLGDHLKILVLLGLAAYIWHI